MDAISPADGQMIVFARWIHFAAVFVLFGSPLFWLYAGRGSCFPTTRLLRAAAPVAAVSGLVWLAGILANMTNGFASVVDPETLRQFFTQTQFGPVALLRLALLASAVLVALSPRRHGGFLAAMGLIGALLLIDQAWLGHAAEGGAGFYGALLIAVYCVHVLAAGAWVGGLPPLLFALFEQRRLSPDEAREKTLEILSRYSTMAMVAVTLIVLSGAANAGFRVGFSFAWLFDADYGMVVAAKSGAVALMLALAFFNRFVAMPRLRASVACELALGLAVLWIASVLGVTPPPQ